MSTMYKPHEESVTGPSASDRVEESGSISEDELEHVLSTPSLADTRSHLPTPEELFHSQQLIAQWQNELDATEKVIIDGILSYLEREGDNMLRERVVKAAKEANTEWLLLNTKIGDITTLKSLRRKQAILKGRLAEERSFISSIRKLSFDIFAEIFSYAAVILPGHFYPDVPSRRLALVCKFWRDILLHTSSLWKTIELPRIDQLIDPPSTLKRRLELAHSTNLDVVLSSRTDTDKQNKLLKILEDVGLERWRGLVLRATDVPTLNGSLSGLKSLNIIIHSNKPMQRDVTSSILDLVAETASTLRYFHLSKGHIPNALTRTNFLSNVVSMKIPSPPTNPPLSLTRVEELELTVYRDRTPFNLPPTTIFRDYDFEDITKCTFSRVTRLNIYFNQQRNFRNQHMPVEMPELVSLSLDGADPFGFLIDFRAPKLVKLELLDEVTLAIYGNNSSNNPGKRRRRREWTEDPGVTTCFDTNKHRVHIKPTDLKLKLILYTESILLILGSWPQLRWIELRDPGFRVEPSFIKPFFEMDQIDASHQQRQLPTSPSSLLQSKELPLPHAQETLLCPELIHLQVFNVGAGGVEVEWWKEVAENMMKARGASGLPLRQISWISDSSYGRIRDEDVL